MKRRALGQGFKVSALTDEQLRELDELFPPGAAAGDRYAPAGMPSVAR
jgi:hypothetical protein